MTRRPQKRSELPGELGCFPPSLLEDLARIHLDADPLLLGRSRPASRQQIWIEGNPAFREIIARFAERAARPSWDVANRYAIAELLRRVRDDGLLHQERRYGPRAYRKLHCFFGLDGSASAALVRLTEVFTQAEVEELARVRMRDSSPLSSYHLELLAGVLDGQARQELLRQTLEESLCFAELTRRVKAANRAGVPSEALTGRPYATPGSLDAVIEQQAQAADNFLNRSSRVWKRPGLSLSAMARELPRVYATAELSQQLGSHAEKMSRLAQEAAEYAAEARRLSQELLQGPAVADRADTE